MLRFEGQVPADSRQIVDTRVIREEPFPEDPQARFEAIFASIGNSEAKCATLLSLPSNYPLTGPELNAAYLASTNNSWETNPRIQAEYCDYTFVPIGFNAKTEILYYGKMNFVKGFRITEAGIKYGQPIAKYLLEQSSTLPFSLGELFGTTSRGGGGNHRGVLTRIRILEELYSTASNSQSIASSTDVAKTMIRDMSTISSQLRALKELGLVEYDSINTEKPGVLNYKFANHKEEKRVEAVRRWPTLTNLVLDVIRDLQTANIGQVVEECNRRSPQTNYSYHRINQVLSGLADQEVLTRSFTDDESKDGSETHVKSQAAITDLGKKIVEQIVIPIRGALSDEDSDLLATWNRIPWQLYAEEGVRKYSQGSPYANSRPAQDWATEALGIIIENPGIRTTELDRMLKTNISIVLRILLDEEVVRREKEGRASRYYPN